MATNHKSKTSPNTTITTTDQTSNSSEIIANNDDLLIQILLKLTVKSLIKSKSVSKHWLSLISDPEFSQRIIPFPTSVSGLFIGTFSFPGYDFIDLNQTSNSSSSHAPIRSLAFPCSSSSSNAPIRSFMSTNSPPEIRILHSCNGLFLCSANEVFEPNYNYVYNPTIRKYTLLPPLLLHHSSFVLGLKLAFDPSKSHHYKVVCVWSNKGIAKPCHIEVYSSKTRTWKSSGYSFYANSEIDFDEGVFWNGSLHWLCIVKQEPSLYFNVEEERLSQMPLPPVPDEDWGDYKFFRYFGESRGHLHLIYSTYNPMLNVYEMEMDYSTWFIKFRVDCSEFQTAFPEITPPFYPFSIVYIVRCDVDEESYAVIRIRGKFLRYNFKSKAIDIFCNIEDVHRRDGLPRWSDTHQFIESLALV
ncbi:hypothetical protein UlMin_026694 [Ulmus minor]